MRERGKEGSGKCLYPSADPWVECNELLFVEREVDVFNLPLYEHHLVMDLRPSREIPSIRGAPTAINDTEKEGKTFYNEEWR